MDSDLVWQPKVSSVNVDGWYGGNVHWMCSCYQTGLFMPMAWHVDVGVWYSYGNTNGTT